MTFDTRVAMRAMVAAAEGVLAGDWSAAKDSVRAVLEGERELLAQLGEARSDGEIDDDALAQQLRDQSSAVADQLHLCASLTRSAAQAVAAAASDAFRASLAAALAERPSARAREARPKPTDRRLNARPDTLDFRDLMYVPTLVEVRYRSCRSTTIARSACRSSTRGSEGACTGFGLATVVALPAAHARGRPRRRRNQPAHALRHGAPLRRVAGRELRRARARAAR